MTAFYESIRIFYCCCLVLSSILCRGQDIVAKSNPLSINRTDSIVKAIVTNMNAFAITGVSVAVFDHGSIVWADGFGFANKSGAAKVDTATLFQAASISKPLAAAAALRLAEDNRLLLDADINTQLTSWKLPDNKFTVTEKVTPRRILSHTAGLTVHGFAGYEPGSKLPNLQQILDGERSSNSKPVRVTFIPGSKEMYSGGGYTILQLLMTEISGRDFSTFMKETILDKAGMDQSSFDLRLSPQKDLLAARGYHNNGKMVKGGYHLYPELAAAGLWTTASDLSRFMLDISASYNGNPGILQQATAINMLTKVPEEAASGLA